MCWVCAWEEICHLYALSGYTTPQTLSPSAESQVQLLTMCAETSLHSYD